jgi:putative ATPase
MSGNLFDQQSTSPRESAHIPLATRMRPKSLDEFIGQEHILKPDDLLYKMIKNSVLNSVIFYGPPSSGKTTLAFVISKEMNADFVTLNAVLDGVKDLKEVVKKAEYTTRMQGKQVILFVDEIHRWNKAQQDALLPHLESGLLTLIGATTENPFYSLVGPLLSRCQLFEMHSFNADDLEEMIQRALENDEDGLGSFNVDLSLDARRYLAEYAGGDIRSVLNALEVAVKTTDPNEEGVREVKKEQAKACLNRRIFRYDRTGDEHYHFASAFIKSMRGSDVDASLYWLSAMIQSGEDPTFVFRRLLIFCSEDIGMADSNVLSVVNNLYRAFEKVGMPEGWYFLSHAVIHCALAPKSNSAAAIFQISAEQRANGILPVPEHLRDKTANKKKSKYTGSDNPSEDYKYPHSFPNHWVEQHYLPDSIRKKSWFSGGKEGFEKRYVERLEKIKED